MHFFEQQDSSRKKTAWLLAFFAFGLVGIVLSLNLALALVLWYFYDEPLQKLWQPELFLAVTLGASVVIILGTLIKIFRLRQGGSYIAERLGGKAISRLTRDPKEKVLINVVEEISLSSGVPMPAVYVLDREKGINAFAAGYCRGFLLLNFGLNAFMLAGFGVAGWLGGFGAVAYMIAGLSPILYLILFMSVVMYNDLIFLRLRCDSMRANIDVALKKRFDLLPRLLETVQAFFRHEQKMQEELTDLRAGKHAHGKILGIMEKYPELKGHHLSTRLMEELRMLEDDIAFMREGYNHAVLVYNTRIEKIPELVLARAFHFMPQAYFQDL